MHGLGDPEEGVVAAYDLPVCYKAEVIRQGYQRAQQFGDPATVGGGVQVQYPRAAQSLGELQDRHQDLLRRDTPISLQGSLSYVNILKHGSPPTVVS